MDLFRVTRLNLTAPHKGMCRCDCFSWRGQFCQILFRAKLVEVRVPHFMIVGMRKVPSCGPAWHHRKGSKRDHDDGKGQGAAMSIGRDRRVRAEMPSASCFRTTTRPRRGRARSDGARLHACSFCFDGSGGTAPTKLWTNASLTRRLTGVSKSVPLTTNVCFCQWPDRTQYRP